MFRRLKTLHKRLEARLSDPAGPGLGVPEGRRRHLWHFQLFDHAFLRVLWTNAAKVADGVYRSNQPSPARMKRLKARGIHTVLSLRGDNPLSFNVLEREAAEREGITLVSIRLHAKRLPSPETLIELEHLFRTLDKPFLLHCKSGSDRAGFASALYLMMIENRPVAGAARQLDWRFLHLKTTPTGVLDHFFRVYDAAHQQTGISLMDWVRSEYDPKAVTRSFKDWLAARKGVPAPGVAAAAEALLPEAAPLPPDLAGPDVQIEAEPEAGERLEDRP